jgi:hypothetical protein
MKEKYKNLTTLRKGKMNNMNNNSVIVRIEKSGNRFNAWDSQDTKWTSEIGTSTRKGAFDKGMALERREGKGGRIYWWKVSMSEYESTLIPTFDTFHQ